MFPPLVSSATQQAVTRLGQAAGTSPATAPGTQQAGESFGTVLGHLIGDVGNSLGHAEALSIRAMSGGNVDTRQVVDAVLSAQESLQTAIAIRDKIVQAYLDISHMAI